MQQIEIRPMPTGRASRRKRRGIYKHFVLITLYII